jgi:hypothetical protein
MATAGMSESNWCWNWPASFAPLQRALLCFGPLLGFFGFAVLYFGPLLGFFAFALLYFGPLLGFSPLCPRSCVNLRLETGCTSPAYHG